MSNTKIKMTPRSSSIDVPRYSPDELLHLRSSLPVLNCVVNKLNKHPDIASIVRLPEEAFRDPDRFTCESRSLVDVTNGRNKQHMSKGHVVESSEESEYQTISSRKANRSSDEVKWNFRRRDASDRTSQPHSAPTGVAAQQSDNFQRFYRAVVSPTHVRVTAGGRIVPNTRTSAPPVFEWNGEKFHFETRKTEPDRDHHNLPPNSWQHSAPPPQGFPPSIPSGFLPHYNFLPRANSIAMATMAPPVQPGLLTTNSPPPPVSGENVAASHQANSLPQQIKISPPTQFDQTKPFMYNGHLVYPVQPGFQPPPGALPVPVSMLGNPGFLPQNPMTAPTGFYPPQFPGTLASMANPFMFPPGQQLPMGIPNGLQPADNVPSLAPYVPLLPPAMVSITELIKSQIQFLQSGLKQMEHKLGNNKHQVEEPFMEHQRSLIASQISNLETMLETQLAQEGAMIALRRDEHGGLGISVPSSKQSTMPSLTSNHTIVAQPYKDTSISIGAQGDSTKPTNETETPQIEQSNGNKKSLARSDSTTKSRLTMAAAMAPPFQPRTQAAIAQASQSHLANETSRSAVTSPIEDILFETQAQIEARLLAKSSTDWGYGGFPVATTNVTLSRTQSAQESSSQRQTEAPLPVFQKFNTFHGETTTIAPVSPPIISPNAVPYLVGKPPNGVSASQVKDSDFVYPRHLTQDEVRARFLYWGKAPRSVQSGLPKFDGKDFYPPSPVKQDARLATVTPSNSISATVPQLNFEKLFDSPAPSPQRIVSSERIAQYNQVSIPNQPASFGTPDHGGYGSLSFHPSFTGLSDWSTHDGRLEDLPQQPQTPSRPTCARNLVISPVTEDFSHLFLERAVPGYKSPSPLHNSTTESLVKFEKEPVTPKNPGSPGESYRELETGRVNSEMQNTAEVVDNDASSDNSSVEFHLLPQNKTCSPSTSHEASFAERVENFRSIEQQTLFLQNMLKNTTQTQMTSPALSGAISSATAHGYLPQYRGSAAASLAPAMVNFATGERDSERSTAKPEITHDSGVAPSISANFLPENRPLNVSRFQRPTPPPAETMGAEEYMRYLTQKNEADKKLLEKQWNTDDSGTGPVSGSDW